MNTIEHLEDLNEDSLKRILECLSTDQRRTLSRASKKWQRLIAESWVDIDLRLGGKNYLDSASKQITWLQSLHLQQLQTLRLHFKGFELSGISVDYLVGPLLELFEQGRFAQLHTFQLGADMSLPDELVSTTVQDLALDVYALTAHIKCPHLTKLNLKTVSMPGPTFFSTIALQDWQHLVRLELAFRTCYLDDSQAAWFITNGLCILRDLQEVVVAFPSKLNIHLPDKPCFGNALRHLEISCKNMFVSVAAAQGLSMVQNLLLVCCGLCVIPDFAHANPAEREVLDQQGFAVTPCLSSVGTKVQCGTGPFELDH